MAERASRLHIPPPPARPGEPPDFSYQKTSAAGSVGRPETTAPLAQIEAFKRRMNWRFKWVSSFNTDFNFDYQVSASPDEKAKGEGFYNYELTTFPSDERPGISVFRKNEGGKVFHTYSSYGRGLDILIGAYNLLDIAPKGRDEVGLKYGMAWVRHHDKYAADAKPRDKSEQPKISDSCCD